jgi:two-component system sensor histidine kinase KdpD
MLGHDIRTPVAGVCGYLEMLDDGWDSLDDADRRNFVARSRAAADRLSAMIDRILALAAVDSGRIEPRPEVIDLEQTLAQLTQAPRLPSVPSVAFDDRAPRTISFDRVHLEQIVGNLITNAFRYGGDPVGLEVTGSQGTVSIAVTDGGDGVPPAQVETLFARFARTGERQAAAGGTGFGLYMAARLAEANGADLQYRAPQGGAPHAFVLSIPER